LLTAHRLELITEFVMSISSVTGAGAASSPSPTRQTKSDSAFSPQADTSTLAPGMSTDAPYDSITVDLPNGISVGVYSFGGSGLDATSLKTIEDFVERMASEDTSRSSTSSTDGGSQTSGTGSEGPDVVGLDTIHVDLPNGISFEVRHSSGGQPTDSLAVMKELTDTAEQLADAFKDISPAATAAASYAATANQATSSDRTAQVDTRT
jgi:hypothetical protein